MAMFYMQYKGREKAAKVVEFVAKWLNLCLSTVQSLSSCVKTGAASFTSSVTTYTSLNFENQDFSQDSGYHISVT